MTIDEYKKLLSSVSDPDIGGTAIITLTDGLVNDLTELQALKATIVENNTTIANLRDTNSKLILRITEPMPLSETVKEETPETALDDLKTIISKEE